MGTQLIQAPHGLLLKRLNQILLAIFYAAFAGLIVVMALIQTPLFWPILITDAVSFVTVSIFRKIYNAPRPYEVDGIAPAFSKDTRGHSFPSRHCFSAFMIALSWLFVFWPLALGLLACAIVLAIVRVKAHVHFVKDVVAGALFAAGFTLVGILPFWLGLAIGA